MGARHSVSPSRIFQLFLAPAVCVSIMLVTLMAPPVGGGLQAAGAGGDAASVHRKYGKGLIKKMQAEDKMNVVVALAEPPSLRSRPLRLDHLKAEIANMQDDVLSKVAPANFRVKNRYRAVPALAGVVTNAGLAKLAANPHVVKIDLDVGGSATLDFSVPQISADAQHAIGNTGEGVVVAVLDTGVQSDHYDLVGDIIHQECFLDSDGSIDGVGLCPNGSDRQSGPGAAEGGHYHGTAITGVITSSGIISPVGVAPDAKIVSIRVIDNTGRFYYFSEIVAALDYIINNRPDVDIINMSLGTAAAFSGDCDDASAYNMAGAAAINTLRALGVIAFAASGNESLSTRMRSPACLSNVVSVGAVDEADVVAGFSNTSETLDILAPGVRILTDYLFSLTITVSGTSLASPHAAGCAALLIAEENGISPDQIEFRLKASPIRVTDPENGLSFPRIDCAPGFCEGDLDHDGDFDGKDLAEFSAGIYAGVLAESTLPLSAVDFGRTNCPN